MDRQISKLFLGLKSLSQVVSEAFLSCFHKLSLHVTLNIKKWRHWDVSWWGEVPKS